MRKLSFLRKSAGLLLAPFALAALPAGAATLDVHEYSIDYGLYDGYDETGNRLFFQVTPEGQSYVVGIESVGASVTLPESIVYTRMVDAEGTEEKTEYVVTALHVTSEFSWIISPLYGYEFTDIILPKSIEAVEYSSNYDKKALHFTSETVPADIKLESSEGWFGSPASLYVVYAPETAVNAYKDALISSPCFVVAEGADPKAAFEQEVADSKALPIKNDDGQSGINIVNWIGEDSNGNVFGFEEYYGQMTLRGIVTKAASVTIPEKVCFVDADRYAFQVLPVTRFCLDNYNDGNTGFPGCDNLTDISVPSCIEYAEWHGEGYAGKFTFHFASENVPEMQLYDGSGDNISICVLDALFMAYSEALGDQDYVLCSETEATPVTVNVATPGTLAEKISTVIENLSDVRWLVITGTPDEIDLRMIRRLPRLEKLDLSGTNGLASVGGCNGLRHLREVILPEGITSLDAGAFYGCRSLRTINIPQGVETIGAQAFRDTKQLKSLDLPASVKTIASEAFHYSGIQTANLNNVEIIEDYAFNDSRLCDVNLSSALRIGSYAFSSSPIRNLTLGKNVEEINDWAFGYCQLSGTLEIPEKVTKLSWCVFANNRDIKKIVLNKNITCIEASFNGCEPEIVECNILFPLNENGFGGSDLSNTTLYVPALTLNEYLLHDNWVNFSNIEALPNSLTVLDLDREYTLKSDKGIADKAELNMYRIDHDNNTSYGHLTVDRTADLNLGTYSQCAYYNYYYYDEWGNWNYANSYGGSTIIPESTVAADKVEVKLNFYKERWYFLSFPFDVNVKDIVVDADALWVVRKYNGEARAKLDENTWQNMTDETVLKAGEGYIFNCAVEDRDRVNFIFTPAANGNALFAKDVVAKELTEYASEFAHNASWNLVGNTYPAYLNIKAIDFDAPITVWADDTYYAYSPVDDDYVLDPFQAFFVQRQSVQGGNAVKLNPAGRAHSREAAAELDLSVPQTRGAGVNLNRSLFNFYVNGESGMDRTRIVVNSEASFVYEANRDASKFMSTSELVPQIFVNNNNVRMAINESPLGNGQFTLGTRFGKAGSYTISLDTRNAAGYSVMLTDNVTGVTTDLMAGAYTFNAEVATDDNRFTVTIGMLSGVDSAVADGLNVKVEGNALNIVADEPVEIMVVAADGKVVASEKSAEFSVTLESGIYVVKVGNVTTKVNISK